MTCPDRPSRPSNRPGLRTLRYRISDYTSFRDRLLDRLTCAFVTADQPQGLSLRKLNVRSNDDPAIALLDAFAVTADVLTFYQERIINEGYLMTATERRSVLELARMIGYELHPGVAASTLLAFTVEDAPNSPKIAAIAKGTQILSIPEQDELPQTFETSADFTAHVEWNALKPRPSRPQKITQTTKQLFLKGTSTGLQAGDLLVLMDGDDINKVYFLTLDRVETKAANGYTLVSWQGKDFPLPLQEPRAIAFRQRANLFGFNAPQWDTAPDAIKLATGSRIKGGVYRANDEAEPKWRSTNTGLLTFDVSCLAVTTNGTLLAGTPIGLFRSRDNGETWALANSGLTNFNIQTIFAGDYLLVGTPGGGVFRSTDEGETWTPIGTGTITVKLGPERDGSRTSEPVNTGIRDTVVRSLLTVNFTFNTPTLSSDDGTVTITRGTGILPLTLQRGDVIVAENQVRTVETVSTIDPADPNALLQVTINDPFRNPPTATDLIGSVRDLSNVPFFAYRPNSATTATPLLPTGRGGNLVLAATDIGVYRSNDFGKNWYRADNPNNDILQTFTRGSNFVYAASDRTIYRSNDSGETWTVTDLTNKTIRALVALGDDAFVATSDGVYRSRNGATWTAINTNLTDTNVWSIAVNSAGQTLFAFTTNGIFRSNDRGDRWEVWSPTLDNPDLEGMSSCAKPGAGDSTFLFAGARFTGFIKEGDEGWRNFSVPTPEPGETPYVDLNTTYSKVVEGSWMVLQSGDRRTNQLHQIQSVNDVQRRDFTLDSKISRVFVDRLIDEPEAFKLREAIALVQSDVLPLMDEPLTVAFQQINLFFDPIWDNKVLLSQYVTRLQADHPVIVSGKRVRAEFLNVGGLVQQDQSSRSDLRWKRTNNGLTNTSVTAFTTHLKPEFGKISSDPTIMHGSGTTFTKELKIGSLLTVEDGSESGETTTVEAIYSDTSVKLLSAFRVDLANGKSFQYTGVGTGAIASKGTVVTGNDTRFKQELNVGVVLKIGAEERYITKITSETSLEIDRAFAQDLPPGTPFRYQGGGTGTIQRDRTAIQGTGSAFTATLHQGQSITIHQRTYQVQHIISDARLLLDAEIDVNSASFSSNTLFVGTAGGGVFRSTDNGATWEAINQGLTTLEIQAIAVRSEQTDREQNGYRLFAGTAIGVFQTNVVASLDDGVKWSQVNGNLVYSDVRSLLPIDLRINNRIGILLAATVDGGVLLLTQDTDGLTWLQTGLANADVQTLILAADGDIYAGTIADRVFRGVIGDRGITWQPLNKGLADNPNVTSLVSYSKAGSGTITVNGRTVSGGTEGAAMTRFTTELAVGDTLTVTDANGTVVATQRVRRIESDSRLDVASPFTQEATGVTFQVTRVFAGTPGSGIFRLKPDTDSRPMWEPVANNPTDLNILCLAADPNGRTLFAGTASGGVFQSIDEGSLWTPNNKGLTSLKPEINPFGKVNTGFRAIALLNQTLYAAGIGILISPDNLYTIPIRSGDRLQVMAPPVPLPPKGRELEDPIEELKWVLRDRDGFQGIVFTATATDVRLQSATTDDTSVSEQNAIARPPQDQQEPLLTLASPIQNTYDPETVKIYANVVPATHGETIQEILGNGDSTLTHQKFGLQKPPLTYVSATTPSGAETTLQIRVNEVLWREVPSLYERSPNDQVYITRIQDDSSVTITVGDGSSGARLPTGLENVVATYRSGIGLVGQVGADRLSLLKTRPLGITDVTNPLPATGAADPESMAEARASAPLTIRTLGRIVSLQDYEDFARAFAGIGKAQADLIVAGETQLLHITVAALEGRPVLVGTPLYTNLVQAIDASRDPVQQVRITSYEAIVFNLEARLVIDPRYLPDRVVTQAKAALLQRFAFEQRQFGQAVTAAEAIATLQGIEGMVAVDLDALHRGDRVRSLEQSVPALSARWDIALQEILPAQLIVINSSGIRLRVEVTL